MSIDEVDLLLPEQDRSDEEEEVEAADIFKFDSAYSEKEVIEPEHMEFDDSLSPEKDADLNSDGLGIAFSPERNSFASSPEVETAEPFMIRPSLQSHSALIEPPLADPFASPIIEKKVDFRIESVT